MWVSERCGVFQVAKTSQDIGVHRYILKYRYFIYMVVTFIALHLGYPIKKLGGI